MLRGVRIEERIGAYLGIPEGGGKRPAVIHLHERYGIVQHTSDLAQKLVDAGYIVLVPDCRPEFVDLCAASIAFSQQRFQPLNSRFLF